MFVWPTNVLYICEYICWLKWPCRLAQRCILEVAKSSLKQPSNLSSPIQSRSWCIPVDANWSMQLLQRDYYHDLIVYFGTIDVKMSELVILNVMWLATASSDIKWTVQIRILTNTRMKYEEKPIFSVTVVSDYDQQHASSGLSFRIGTVWIQSSI